LELSGPAPAFALTGSSTLVFDAVTARNSSVSVVAATDFSRVTLRDCLFADNAGSAVRLQQRARLNATDTLFVGNFAPDRGGAVRSLSGTAVSLLRCGFLRNRAAGYGGAVALEGRFTVEQCLFERNTAGVFGGAGVLRPDAASLLSNSTSPHLRCVESMRVLTSVSFPFVQGVFMANGGVVGAVFADGTAIPTGRASRSLAAALLLTALGVFGGVLHCVPAGSLAVVGTRFESHRDGFPVVLLQHFSAAACPTVDRCSFANNSQPASPTDQNGLLDVRAGCLFLTRSSFTDNRGWLGAMVASASSDPVPAAPVVLQRVTMANNTGRQFVALFALTAQPFIVDECAALRFAA
jgi:hypothetical protein